MAFTLSQNVSYAKWHSVSTSYRTNYSLGGNAYDYGQTNVLLTPGSIVLPQMAALPLRNANDTLGPESERKDTATLSLIITGVESEPGSGYYGSG